MKKLIPFLVITGMLMVGIKTPKAQQTCYDGVCFPDGERSFADSYISYDPGLGAEDCCNKPSAAEGSPDYQYDQDGSYVSLGCYGVLVVKFTDNSLTTSGDTDEDLWVFEVGAYVESTNIDISTDGVDWIEVGSTSGATSGIDIDAYTGDGVVLGEQYSYVRIIDKECRSQSPPYPGADIDAVGAIESADPVTTTTTTTELPASTTTVPATTTTTTVDTTTTTTPADTTTTTTPEFCDPLIFFVCGDTCCEQRCCGDQCCNSDEVCTSSNECVFSIFNWLCPLVSLYGEGSVEVDLLRDFRDNVLTQTPEGQELIDLYYQWSPAIVQAMEADEEFKEDVKEMVDGVLELITETE